MAGGGSRIKAADFEVLKNPTDKFDGKAMAELFFHAAKMNRGLAAPS